MAACPSSDQLRQLLLGSLPETDLEALSDHLAKCPSCLQTVESLKIDDTLSQAVRQGAKVASEAQRMVQRGLLESVQGLANTSRKSSKSKADVAEAATIAPDVPLSPSSENTSPSALEETG